MKKIAKLLLALLPIVAVSCNDEPEPEKLPEPVVTISAIEVSGTTASASLTIENGEKACYILADGRDVTNINLYSAGKVLSGGQQISFSAEESFEEPQSVTLTLDQLTIGHSYYLFVAAANNEWSTLQHRIFDVLPTDEDMPNVDEVKVVELTATAATFEATVRNVDMMRYAVVPESVYNENLNGNGLYCEVEGYEFTRVEVERSKNPTSIDFAADNLTPETDYVAVVYVNNADIEMVPIGDSGKVRFTTPSDSPAAVMSDIEIVSMVGHSVEFSVTARYIDSFGFVVVPTAEWTEMSADEIIAASLTYVWDDGNLSWEQDFTFPFSADTNAETEYIVVAAAKNATSEVVKSTIFTTPREEMTVEKLSFKPTRLVLRSSGSDHYLTMSTALYELCVHLVSDTFGGRYDNNDDDPSHNFVAEGTYFKELNVDDTWTTYGDIDLTIGNIDLYENVVTGKWETYGSFCFAMPDGENSWLTIEIEIPSGTTIEGAERTEPAVFNFAITKAEAVQDETNKAIWNLTLEQDANNSLTFRIKLDSSKYEYIPSGSYVNDGQGTPCLDGCSMIVNNVSTSLGAMKYGLSRVNVDYNASTGETYVSAEAYVKSGTAVVKIAKCGPFKLYEKVEQGLAEFTESRNLMIWASWMAEATTWALDWAGDNFYGYLYFVTGKNSANYLPEGRYYLRTSAPADGSMWVDCTKSFVAKLRTSDEMKIKTDAEDAYIDVTVVEQDGTYLNTIKGTLYTTNGFYKINFDYGTERGPIY